MNTITERAMDEQDLIDLICVFDLFQRNTIPLNYVGYKIRQYEIRQRFEQRNQRAQKALERIIRTA